MKNKNAGKFLREANKVYPDGCIEYYFNLKTGIQREVPLCGGGDTLAKFIGIEIAENFDPGLSDKENRENIESALAQAAEDLVKVIAHFRWAELC